jgi:hypothetical protein
MADIIHGLCYDIFLLVTVFRNNDESRPTPLKSLTSLLASLSLLLRRIAIIEAEVVDAP